MKDCPQIYTVSVRSIRRLVSPLITFGIYSNRSILFDRFIIFIALRFINSMFSLSSQAITSLTITSLKCKLNLLIPSIILIRINMFKFS